MLDMSGILFFDGDCGMCTRVRNFLLRLDRTGGLQTEPFQRTGSADRLGIPASRVAESVWWLDSSGDVFAGAEALNAALAAAIGTRLPLIVYRLLAVRFLQDAAYFWVAAHRYRFPGTTPHCQSNPVDC
jgi:predicted DCC family thiol-disulfide oxidoreductase YuxK